MKSLKLQSLDFIKNPEDILDFYKSLGWDGDSNLDVKKIVLNDKDCRELAGNFIDNGTDKEDKTKRSLLWLSYGPSFKDNVPRGKVYIYK